MFYDLQINWLGYLSCAVNPLIYALRSPAFREGYRQILCFSHHTSKPNRSKSHFNNTEALK